MQSLTLTQPDDWHLHLRDGKHLATTCLGTAQAFGRAIVMPNLQPPVTTVADAEAYRTRILQAMPKDQAFEPLMTLYLTNQTTTETIHAAKEAGHIYACKLYPAGATTHSDAGITNINAMDPVFSAMEHNGIPLLVHGEVTDREIDVFDREIVFIETVLMPLQQRFPKLPIVLEHITTSQAVDYVKNAPANVAATITPHHLLFNRNDMLVGGIKPHYYCLPILKRQQHQQALIAAAISGNPKFFLGTDSAPHAKEQKESSCGCAGIYSAPYALQLYAEVFYQHNALEKLEAFSSFFGPGFYQLPRNTKKITLVRKTVTIPTTLPYGEDTLIPIHSGHELPWTITT